MGDVASINRLQVVDTFEVDKMQEILNLFPNPDFLNVAITAYFDFSHLDKQIRKIYPFFNIDDISYTHFKLRAPDRATILDLYRCDRYEFEKGFRGRNAEKPENYNPSVEGMRVNFESLEWEQDVKHRKFKATVTRYEVSVEYFAPQGGFLESRLNEILEGTDGRLNFKLKG